MNTKTPVMILQELMVKRNSTPHFELLERTEGYGTHMPTFYYQVTAGPVTAIGQGRSKKDAKHEAAKQALENLKQHGIYHPTEASVPTSPWKVPKETIEVQIDVKAVAELQELCFQQNLPEPDFDLINQEGPPHCPQFTVQCRVGNMTATSVSTTKKKAKHIVAIKILERLKDMLPEAIEEMAVESKKTLMSKENIENMYKENTIKRKINWSRRIMDFPRAIKEIMEEKEINHSKLWKDVNITNLEDLKEFLNRLDLECTIETVEAYQFLHINSDPELDFIAKYENGILSNECIEKTIEFLKMMSH